MLQYNGRPLLYRAMPRKMAELAFISSQCCNLHTIHHVTTLTLISWNQLLCWIPFSICWPSSSNVLNHCDLFHPVSGVSEGTFWGSDSTAPLQRNKELKWPIIHNELYKGCYRCLSEGFRSWVKQCPHSHYTGCCCSKRGFSLLHHSMILQSLHHILLYNP